MDNVDIKAWHSRVKQKLKLSLRKDSLNEKINAVRYRNQAFLAISQQIARFNASWAPVSTTRDEVVTDESLEKIEKLRTASKILYKHLEKLRSCPIHAEHSSNLRLCFDTSELYLDTPPKMSFDMTLTYWGLEQSAPPTEDLILLSIESTLETANSVSRIGQSTVRFADQKVTEELEPKQIRRQDSIDSRRKKAESSRTHRFRGLLRRFKGEESDTPQASSREYSKLPETSPIKVHSRTQPQQVIERSIQDLGIAPDLCLRILETSRYVGGESSVCIGFLAGLSTDRYTVYAREPSPSAKGGATPLSKVIANHRRQQDLSKSAKWRLAGSLSLATLLYHSTPWLRSELNSDSILFFGDQASSRFGSLKAPYLHSTQVEKGKSQERNALSNDGQIKNEMLHCLGVLLLELEFEDTFKNLLDEVKLDGLNYLNFSLLQRLLLLKRRAGSQLGTLYV